MHGDGVPEGLVYAPQGSVYMRQGGTLVNGGVLYLKRPASGSYRLAQPRHCLWRGLGNPPTGMILSLLQRLLGPQQAG